MRLCFRLAVPVVLLMGGAISLVYVRTETVRASNHLHSLYREKGDLERACRRWEMTLADLKRPQRLREKAVRLESPAAEDESVLPQGTRRPTNAGRTAAPRP